MNLSDKMIARLRASAHGALDDRFEVKGEAGSGGMGVVYRAVDREGEREVALKVLRGPGATLERFEREAAILERLDHPAIVEYVAHGVTDEGEPWLAMEWLDGVSLSDRLHGDAGPIPLRDVVACSIAVTDALAAAHEAGIIHRDLKPSNLFLVGGRLDAPKVLDFGVARLRVNDGAAELTQTGQAIGTPGYMAPEQIRGAKDADARADLFSLGCVIYRIVTGRPAFEGDDVLSVIAKLALETPTPIEDLVPEAPPGLGALVARLMAKSAAERPASAKEVSIELARILAEIDGGHVSSRTSARPPDPDAPTELADTHESLPTGRLPTPSPGDSPQDDAAPASTLPSSTEFRAAIARPRKRVLLVAIAGTAVAAATLLAWSQLGASGVPPMTSASSSPAPTPPTPSATATSVASVYAPDLRAETRASAALACHSWSEVLARGQKSDGSFAMEPHRKSSGWDTGQQLTALAAATPACGGAGRLSLQAGSSALATLRHDGGWSGPGSAEKDTDAGSAAWAVLALAWTHEATAADAPASDFSKIEATLRDAEKSLLGFQRPDGSFRFVSAVDVPNEYLSVLGTWALVEALPLDPKLKEPRERAVSYLRARVSAEQDAVRTTPGLMEQAVWVLLRARARSDAHPDDDALLESVARDVVSRCALGPGPDAMCTRSITDAGTVKLEGGERASGTIATFWHPWATLASAALAGEPVVKKNAELARDLAQVARFGAREFERGLTTFAAAPTYKLSEYLFAAAMLSEHER